MTEVIMSPLWAARNWSADAGDGSIHDDSTAKKLGFLAYYKGHSRSEPLRIKKHANLVLCVQLRLPS